MESSTAGRLFVVDVVAFAKSGLCSGGFLGLQKRGVDSLPSWGAWNDADDFRRRGAFMTLITFGRSFSVEGILGVHREKEADAESNPCNY